MVWYVSSHVLYLVLWFGRVLCDKWCGVVWRMVMRCDVNYSCVTGCLCFAVTYAVTVVRPVRDRVRVYCYETSTVKIMYVNGRNISDGGDNTQ